MDRLLSLSQQEQRRQETGQTSMFDLMGLNSVAMGHSKGDRRGDKNHSAFEKEVFYKTNDSVNVPIPKTSNSLNFKLSIKEGNIALNFSYNVVCYKTTQESYNYWAKKRGKNWNFSGKKDMLSPEAIEGKIKPVSKNKPEFQGKEAVASFRFRDKVLNKKAQVNYFLITGLEQSSGKRVNQKIISNFTKLNSPGKVKQSLKRPL